MDTVVEIPAKRFDIEKGIETETREWVVAEKKYQIMASSTEVATISASPDMIKELVVGYLVGGGFLHFSDIADIQVDESTITVATGSNSAEGIVGSSLSEMAKNTIESPLKIPVSTILHAVSQLQFDAEIWKKTNATHSAALCTGEGTLGCLAEDVSRHSAFCKAIGWALLNNFHGSSFIALSGRISQDMIIGAKNVGIPLIASRSTIIEPAAALASAFGITVIGYVREGHLVVFAHPERVVL
jgi:FdhD protein